MARSIGGAVVEGIEAGFGLGMRADEAALRKKADARAEEEFTARRARETNDERRKGVAENLDLLDREMKLVGGRQEEIKGLSTAAQTAGQPVDPVLAKEYGANAEKLTGLRQRALDYFSRAQTGQLDPMQSPSRELYTNLVAATGRPLAELREVPKYTADVQAGLETGNEGLLVQGVNGLLGPQLRRGVGQPSPHGGTITRKEVIGMDPAVDNNGTPLPGKFMPRLRVYVQMDEMSPERHYDAPMTVDGSGDDDDKVAVIDVKNAMQWMGNLGTLATAVQRPDVAAKLEAGEKEAGPEMKKWLDQLTAVSRPKTEKGAAHERMALIQQYAKQNGLKDDEAAVKLQRMGVIPSLSGLGAKLAAADELGGTPAEKDLIKRDVILGSGGKTTGLIPQKPGKSSGAGGGAGGGGGGGAESTMSAKYGKDQDYTKQVNYWAELVANGGQVPARFSQIVGKEMAGDVFKAVAGLGTANDQIANNAAVQGLKAGARAAGTRAANFGLAKSEAYEMADLVTQASVKNPRTSFMPINKALNAFKTNTGDVEVRQFGAALNSFINAYARAVSPVGVPTVSDKDHAREMLSTADSHEQVVGIIAQLKKEMEAAGNAPKVVQSQQREAALNLGKDRDAAARKPAPPAVGAVVKGYRFKGGDPASQASWEKVQ